MSDVISDTTLHLHISELPSKREVINIVENGEYDVRDKGTANVAVPQASGKVTITGNGTNVNIAQYATADIAVPQGVFPAGTLNIDAEGTYDVTNYASAKVEIGKFIRDPAAPNLDLLRQPGKELAHGSGYNVAFLSFYVPEKWAEGTFVRFSGDGINNIKEVIINSDGTWTAAADQPNVINIKYLYATATWPAVGWHCLRVEYNANVKQSLAAYDSAGLVPIFKMIYECYMHLPGLQKEGYTQIVGNHCVVIDAAPASNADWSGLLSGRAIVIEFDHCDTSNVTNMSKMFNGCNSLQSVDLSSFNTSSVTNMSQMFYGCNILQSVDLSSFNTSSVTNMSQMFYACNSLQSVDLSSFNTSSVTNMSQMFSNCHSLISLSFGDKQTHQFPKTGTASNTWTAANTVVSTNTTNLFSDARALMYITNFISLKTSFTINNSTLTAASLVEIIEELETVATTQTLTIGATNIAKLTEDQLAIAQDKGWTVT